MEPVGNGIHDPDDNEEQQEEELEEQQQHNYQFPTGIGWGGTTNINAGLCWSPPLEDFLDKNNHNNKDNNKDKNQKTMIRTTKTTTRTTKDNRYKTEEDQEEEVEEENLSYHHYQDNCWPLNFADSILAIQRGLEQQPHGGALRFTTNNERRRKKKKNAETGDGTTTTSGSSSSSSSNESMMEENNSSRVILEFPSHHCQIPCVATWNGHRINYYSALVAPLVMDVVAATQVQQQQGQEQEFSSTTTTPSSSHSQGHACRIDSRSSYDWSLLPSPPMSCRSSMTSRRLVGVVMNENEKDSKSHIVVMIDFMDNVQVERILVMEDEEEEEQQQRRENHEAIPKQQQQQQDNRRRRVARGVVARSLVPRQQQQRRQDPLSSTRVLGTNNKEVDTGKCNDDGDDDCCCDLFQLYATQHVILAAGVLESPALLVASDLLRQDSLSSSVEKDQTDIGGSSNNKNNNPGPIFFLQDHVGLPSASLFLFPPKPAPTSLSCNGVAEVLNFELQLQDDNDREEEETDADDQVRDGNVHNSSGKSNDDDNNKSPNRTRVIIPRTKKKKTSTTYSFQVTRMDSVLFPDVLPGMAADLWMRWFYCCPRISSTVQMSRRMSEGTARRTIWMIKRRALFLRNGMVRGLANILRVCLRWLLLYVVPTSLLDRCLTVLTLFLLTPSQPVVGSFSVVPKKKKKPTTTTTYGMNMTTPTMSSTTAPRYRSDYELNIQLDRYLELDSDINAYARAWPVALQLLASFKSNDPDNPRKSRNYGWEVLPGAWIRNSSSSSSCNSNWWLAAWARAFCFPYYHWCGSLTTANTTPTPISATMTTISNVPDPATSATATTPADVHDDDVDSHAPSGTIGTKKRTALDPSSPKQFTGPPPLIRIHSNVSQLSVCDASALPSLPRAPTALTCAALGHALACQLLSSSSLQQPKQQPYKQQRK